MDSWDWDFGDGAVSSSKDPAYLYSAAGTYAVSLKTSKGGCTKSCMGSVVVKEMPDCSWTSSSPACNGTPVQFSGPVGMDAYSWEFGDGAVSSAKDPTHLYSAPGTYSVNLKATKSGCTKSCPGSVVIKPIPDCSWTSNAPVCSGTAVQFTGPSGMESYQWDFGDGAVSSSKDPSYLYSAPGTYSVALKTTKSGCSKICTGSVVVTAIDCSWTSSSPVSKGTPVQFTGPAGMDAYQWDFGDGAVSSAKDPAHLYSRPSTYTVSLAVSKEGCSRTCTGSVVVKSEPGECWTSNSPICVGTAVVFDAPSGMDKYVWDFDDGARSYEEDPSHLYSAPGKYLVVLTMKKGGIIRSCPGYVVVKPLTDCSTTLNVAAHNGTAARPASPSGISSNPGGIGGGRVSSRENKVRIYPG
jgi:PKD repeat protein